MLIYHTNTKVQNLMYIRIVSPLRILIQRNISPRHSSCDNFAFSRQLKSYHKIKGLNRMTDQATISYVTVPKGNLAQTLSRKLIEHRLAACVNIINGIESVYEWEGKVQNDSECLLIIKSHTSKTKDLTEFIEKNHTYECPEVITVQVDSGSTKYLDWIQETINKSPISVATTTMK